jgi:DNA-binding IclR family transcriptional regulator
MPDHELLSVHRVLSVLRAISKQRGKVFGVTDIAKLTGLANSTTHRYLRALVQEGILCYEEATNKYQAK